MKRVLSIAMALILVFSLAITAYAEEGFVRNAPITAEQQKELDTRIATLKQDYGVSVTYNSRVGEYGLRIMNEIEKACKQLGATFTSTVANHYGTQGKSFHISIEINGENNVVGPGFLASGTFMYDTATLIVYVNPYDQGFNYIEGINMVSSAADIIHEFGHAFHAMAYSRYGYDKMQAEWTAFNKGISYGQWNSQNSCFVSSYASQSYLEDFAETFRYMVDKTTANSSSEFELKVSQNDPLYAKFVYMEKLVKQYISDDCVISRQMDRFLATGLDA